MTPAARNSARNVSRRAAQRAAALAHPCADLPVAARINITLAVLSARGLTPRGGWTTPDLAELCGCSDTAIVLIERRARRKLRHALASRGLTLFDLIPTHRP